MKEKIGEVTLNYECDKGVAFTVEDESFRVMEEALLEIVRTEEDLEYTSRISELYTNYSELLSYCDNPKWDEKKKGFTLLNAFIKENKSLFTSSKVNQETIFNSLPFDCLVWIV